MKWSFATVGIIFLGLIGVAVILLFQQITTNNENDYYLLKEVTEAAMIDAIDIPYYRETGDLKIVTEKFIENFTRRFAESTIFVTNDYKINFYNIMETPPKVSIIVNTGLGEYTINGNSDDYNIANKLDAILEYTDGKYTNVDVTDSRYNNVYVNKTYEDVYYSILSDSNTFNKNYSLKIPMELTDSNIRNIAIKGVSYVGVVNNQVELNEAILKEQITFNGLNTEYMQFINDFSKNISNINILYYNCNDKKGTYINSFKCKENDYWINVSGTNNDTGKDKVIIKYKVIWSYEEYELKK